MVKCVKCGTGWTSSGLPLCPVCGTKVEAPAPAAAHPYVIQTPAVQEAVRKNGSAVLDIPKVDPPKAEPYSFPVLKRVEPAAEPAKPPEQTAEQVRKPEAPKPEVKERPVQIEPPAPAAVETLDASAVYPPIRSAKVLRTSSRPLNGPIILGCLAYVAVIMLPITMAFEGHKVIGVLGFTLAGFFAPFAPIAWLAGLSAEQRRRDQELRAERRVTLGRLLGQWGTLLLVIETTVGLISIAALRLSSKFPPSFWRGEF